MAGEELDRRSNDLYFVTGTLTTTAAALGSSTKDLTELVIQADPDNSVDILLGSASAQGWKLEPGDQFNLPIRNPGLLWGRTASGTAVYSMFGRYGN